MGLAQDILETVAKLSALEARTEDVARMLERMVDKFETIIERLSRLEEKHDGLRDRVRSEILADVKADLARMQVVLDYEKRGVSNRSDRRAVPDDE